MIEQTAPKKYSNLPEQITEADDLVELIKILQAVDTTAPLAKLNETSISDNNGGRIEL